jgi:hypothetical protein
LKIPFVNLKRVNRHPHSSNQEYYTLLLILYCMNLNWLYNAWIKALDYCYINIYMDQIWGGGKYKEKWTVLVLVSWTNDQRYNRESF